MTLEEVAQMVASIGLPYAYHHFDEEQIVAPPYIRWYFNGIDDMYADNINFQSIPELRIELYTDFKDFETENTMEAVFSGQSWAYDKIDAYIESERLYCTTFAGDVVITKEEDETNG